MGVGEHDETWGRESRGKKQFEGFVAHEVHGTALLVARDRARLLEDNRGCRQGGRKPQRLRGIASDDRPVGDPGSAQARGVGVDAHSVVLFSGGITCHVEGCHWPLSLDGKEQEPSFPQIALDTQGAAFKGRIEAEPREIELPVVALVHAAPGP